MRATLLTILLCVGMVPVSAEARLLRELPPTVRRYASVVQRSRTMAERIQRRALASARITQRVSLRTNAQSRSSSSVSRSAELRSSSSSSSSVASSVPPAPRIKPVPVRPAEPAWEIGKQQAEVLRLTNREREKEGLGSLRIHGLLQQVADRYAFDMSVRDFFSHRSPDGDASLDRIRASGYLTPPCDCIWSYATGENIARGQKTAEEVVGDWMQSPSHRANILNPVYTEIGIGLYEGYWTQEFGNVTVRE